MLINLSNHASSAWSEQQMQAANEQYGDIVDMAFPAIDPWADEADVDELANVFLSKIKLLANDKNTTAVVHLMGEFSFTYALVNKLKAEGIDAIVSTSERQAEMNADGSKTIRFDFVRFRKY